MGFGFCHRGTLEKRVSGEAGQEYEAENGFKKGMMGATCSREVKAWGKAGKHQKDNAMGKALIHPL